MSAAITYISGKLRIFRVLWCKMVIHNLSNCEFGIVFIAQQWAKKVKMVQSRCTHFNAVSTYAFCKPRIWYKIPKARHIFLTFAAWVISSMWKPQIFQLNGYRRMSQEACKISLYKTGRQKLNRKIFAFCTNRSKRTLNLKIT